eukprot:jgi/Botrbrau1/20414/Bobra.0006s0069.1
MKTSFHTPRQLVWLETGHTLALFWIILLIFFVWMVGASRIIDYKHHASDVVAGFIVGAFFGILFALYAIWTHPLVAEKARILEGLPAEDQELLPAWAGPRPAADDAADELRAASTSGQFA